MDNNKKDIFPQETIDALVELGEVLRRIDTRMKSEGYHIVNGKIVHMETGEEWVKKPEKFEMEKVIEKPKKRKISVEQTNKEW